jgi:hypothetical protein
MQVDLPIFYGNKMRRKMKAGAGCEDLKMRCPHYYSVATRLHTAMQVRSVGGEGWLHARLADIGPGGCFGWDRVQ